MQICAISDTHGHHLQLDLTQYPADILIHAGDWTKGYDDNFSETKPFLHWLSRQPYNNKILIAGNHELTVEANEQEFRNLLKQYPSITYLQNSSVTIDNINFFGSPYSNEFCNWAFMEEDIELATIWQEIPDNTDVLITHGPAYNCHDLVENAYNRDPHVGSKSLRQRKLALQDTLKLHISGHIHPAYGTSETHCTNICASLLNDRYQLVNKPILKEI